MIQFESAHYVDAFSLERIINKHYNTNLEILTLFGSEGTPNYVAHRFNVNKDPLSKWDHPDADNPYNQLECNLKHLLNRMCREGLIEEGVLFVEVSW